MGIRFENPKVNGGKMSFEKGIEAYGGLIEKAANENNVPKYLLAKLLYTESAFDVNAVSSAGAKGIAQFMEGTAKEFGVNREDPESSINGAAKYLSKAYNKFGDWKLAVASYNAGMYNKELEQGMIPNITETQNYVKKIFGSSSIQNYEDPHLNLSDFRAKSFQFETSVDEEMMFNLNKLRLDTEKAAKEEMDNKTLQEAKNNLIQSQIERDTAINLISNFKLDYESTTY